MFTNDKSKGAHVIWWYGWTKTELVELLHPVVAIRHIQKGSSLQSKGTRSHYFNGSRYEINLIRGHMLIEKIYVEHIAPRLWACNKSPEAKIHRPHSMMGKPTILKMNSQDTITGRMNYAKPGITEQDK